MGELSRLERSRLLARLRRTIRDHRRHRFGAGVISTGSFPTALILLIQRPQLRNLLHEKPELIPAGVEELLRIISPADGLPRFGHRRHPGRRRAGPQGSWCWCCRGRQLRSRALQPGQHRTDRPNLTCTRVRPRPTLRPGSLSVAATHRSASNCVMSTHAHRPIGLAQGFRDALERLVLWYSNSPCFITARFGKRWDRTISGSRPREGAPSTE